MLKLPALLLFASALLLASGVLAATPERMSFNESPAADVKGAVTAVDVDGAGRWGAVSVADGPATIGLTDDRDLFVYNLDTESLAWDARDNDAATEGARMVAVANGTAGSPGAWLVLVNNSVPNLLSGYRTTGVGVGGAQGQPAWVHNAFGGDVGGTVNSIDVGNDGVLVGVATGAPGQNTSWMLLQNRFGSNPNKELHRTWANLTQYSDVTAWTAIALSSNSTVPAQVTTTRAVYTVVGAETTGVGGVRGAIYVFETVFDSLERPSTRQVFARDTNARVTEVAIASDGEYAVAGTQDGVVYLVTVVEALSRKGLNLQTGGLVSSQQSVGDAVTSLVMSNTGEFFAAGTEGGDVVLFRNRLDAAGSTGSSAVELGKINANTPLCSPALQGPVASLAMTEGGEVVVVGARNGIFALEATAFANFRLPLLEPAWCIPYSAGDVGNGVQADVSGNGKVVFAGTGHRAFGYNSFYKIGAQAMEGTRKSAEPGQRVQYAIQVRNDGSLFDRVNLTVTGPQDPGWEFTLSNGSLLLMPGRTQTVLVNVTSPPTLAPGNFSLRFAATPDRASRDAGREVVESIDLRLDLGQLRRVEIRVPEGTLIASQGTENRFPITIRNGGNAPDRFRVSAVVPEPQENFKSPGSEWVLRMDPVVVDVPANGEAVTNLTVTPESAQRGDSVTIQLSVEPDVVQPDEGFIGDSKQVVVAVEPSYNGDVSLLETKDYRVEPGGLLFINYTVKNLGNTRDVFVVKNRTEPPNEPGWKLQLSDERFELRTTNAQKVVRLSVSAQLGLSPGESVQIHVDLLSEGLQKQLGGGASSGQVDSQSVTVTVVPKERRGLPGPPEPLLALAVLGLALALRRRGA